MGTGNKTNKRGHSNLFDRSQHYDPDRDFVFPSCKIYFDKMERENKKETISQTKQQVHSE